jgi:hypothetical protein
VAAPEPAPHVIRRLPQHALVTTFRC